MAKLNIESIKLTLASQKGAVEAIVGQMDVEAENIVSKNKEEFLTKFEEHVVSQEIEEGPQGTNISNTLNGKGNLFSFIGFEAGREPIKEVTQILDNEIKLDTKLQGRNAKGRFKSGGDNLLFDYRVNIPTKESLFDRTPLEWEPTKSWLQGIEQGIAGFTSYIYWKTAGRSTGGIQANDGREKNGRFNGEGKPIKLRDGRFNNIPYFSALYKEFKDKF